MKRVRRCLDCGMDISNLHNRCIRCKKCQDEKTKENKERWEAENRKKRDVYRKGERIKSKSKGSNPLNRSIWKTHTHKESEMGESVYKFTSLMDELDILTKRKDDEDYLNSLLERYNLKLYPYEYPALPEIKRKYNKLKQTLRSGLVVSGEAYNQVIQNKRDDTFTPPHSEMGLSEKSLDDVWGEIDDLRHKIDGMKSSMRDLYVESKKENPSISRGEFISTERFRNTFGEIQELERKMKMLGEIWNWRNGKIRHQM
jgi:hypothetical protein